VEKGDKIIWQQRDERVDHFLWVILDDNRDIEHFAKACLIHSIRRASQSADRLSKRVMYLNLSLVVLGGLGLIVTGLGLVIAAYGVFCK
jgi:hypothetical protein